MSLEVLVEELNRMARDEKNRSHPGRVAAATEAVRTFSQSFVAATEDQRKGSRTGLTDEARRLLLNFAWDSAELAVQDKLPALVAGGLLTIAIEGGELDAGVSAARMAVLCRSAQRLGLDVKPLFRQAAAWATSPQLAAAMRDFPSRSAEDTDLTRTFSIRETASGNGFHYLQQPLPVKCHTWSGKLRGLFGRWERPTRGAL